MKTVGILGGMGPLATADFMQQLILLTPATIDQEHIPLIVHSVPQIPNRIASILGDGESPLPTFIKAIKTLEHCGAEIIVIPCNTAHYWYDALQENTHAEIIHIVDAVAHNIAKKTSHPHAKIGILATNATTACKIYQSKLEDNGYPCLIPDTETQQDVDDAINLIKGNELQRSKTLLERAAQRLQDAGAEFVVLGCTELPIVLQGDSYIDSNQALALQVIDRVLHTK